MQLLLDHGTDADSRNKRNASALHMAIAWGNVKIVQIVLDNGADINIQDERGRSPIEVLSSSDGRPLEIMQMLLDRGAKLGSALQIASYNGIEEFVNILLDHGADINARQKVGMYGVRGDALQVASFGGQEKTVRLLLQRGANITARGKLFDDARHVVSFLILTKARGILLDRYPGTPTYTRVPGPVDRIYGYLDDIVQMLLEEGFDTTQSGLTSNALQAASFVGHEKIVKILRERGAHMTSGELPSGKLPIVSSAGRERIIQILLERGDDIIQRELSDTLSDAC